MKRKCNAIICLLSVFLYLSVQGSCTQPISGIRVWNIAEIALIIMESIESKLLQIPLDFQGTFTVINELAMILNADEALALTLNSNLDQLLISLDKTINDVLTIESKVEQLAENVDALSADISATFTALEGLKTTIGSKLDVVIQDLQVIESNIELLAQTEVDQQITISSHLNVLQTDVNLLNSALDSLSFIENISVLDASLLTIISVTDRISVNVSDLQNIIETDFSGTWTALQAQLELACTVESLVDSIHLINETDFSGVFTSLALLQQTVNDIDSMIDLSSMSTSEVLACNIESKIALALQTLSSVQAEVLLLPALGQSIISLLSSDITLLDGTSSLLDITITLLDSINSSLDTITSKVELIEGEILINSSNLEVIATGLAEINSDLDNIDISVSLFDVSDSLLESAVLKAYTIESIIDSIIDDATSVDSKIDAFELISKSALLESDIALIADEIEIIDSKADLLVTEESIINGIFDVIINEGVSSVELLLTIDSQLEAIASGVDVSSIERLNSLLETIDSQVNIISSNMVSVDSKLASAILLSQDLVSDFQETWTVLDAISNILTSDQLNMQTISSKLSNINLTLDLSSVYTVINGIIDQKYTVDTKVDIYSSLVNLLDNLVVTDFSAVFTALNMVTQGDQTINSQLDHLNSDVDVLNSYFGTPIYNRNVGISGYVISQSGRYYLAEDILFTPTVNFTGAISINGVNDVTIDLNGRLLQQSSSNAVLGNGISVVNANNIRIFNGTVDNFSGATANGAILLRGVTNVLLEDMNLSNGRTSGFNGVLLNNNSQNIIMRDIVVNNMPFNGILLDGSASLPLLQKNILLKKIEVLKGDVITGFGAGIGTSVVLNLVIKDSIVRNNLAYGILAGTPNNLVQNCIAHNNGISGILIASARNLAGTGINSDVKNCISMGNPGAPNNTGGGIIIETSNGRAPLSGCSILNNTAMNNGFGLYVHRQGGAAPGINNCCFLNNVAINNNSNLDEFVSTGPNTYLGNFCFNSTAVGNPNNRNYFIAGSSNITNKFLTINQTGISKLPTLAGEWYNINMLP